jgi:transposase
MPSRGPDRRHAPAFKIQLCQDIRSGAIGRRNAAKKYVLSTNLIRLWLTQYDRGELSTEEAEASVITEYEAKIAALEHNVGLLTMELDLVKKLHAFAWCTITRTSQSSPARSLLNSNGMPSDRSSTQHVLLLVNGSGRRSGRRPARRVE